jgi:hypothetical protein
VVAQAKEMPFVDMWEIWTHKEPRATTYCILYWARYNPVDKTVEVRRVEMTEEGMLIPVERLMKGPRFPLAGFLRHYEIAEAYA